jgi:RHS repeat-associated protein
VLLSGENSVANCGFIDQYRWRARPVGGTYITLYQGSSPTYNLTVPLLNDGETERLYEVELRVRNSSNLYHTRTIQVTVTRNNKSFYYLTDHLGSVRVTVDERGDPVGWDDYYPFGLQMPGRSQQQYGSPLTDAKFTGHELNQEGGLGLYHAGARLYDDVLSIFYALDPAGQTWHPFGYAGNNPVVYVDEDGRWFVIPLFIGAVIGEFQAASKGQQGWDRYWTITKSAGISVATSAFTMGIGGVHGVAIGSALVNTADAYMQGARDEQLFWAGVVGLGTGYFSATGGFGLAGAKDAPSFFGRLSTQIISTSSRSIGNNLVLGRPAFKKFSFGAGPLNFRMNNGHLDLLIKDNWGTALANTIGATNYITNHLGSLVGLGEGSATIDWDWTNLSPEWGGGGFWNKISGRWTTGAYTVLNLQDRNDLPHEFVHVFQSRFWGNSIFGIGWLPIYGLASLQAWATGKDIYEDNFFERQAQNGWR